MSVPNATVYVIDDDASIRKAMTRMFKSLDLQVLTFENADEFLHYPRPDQAGCLILDVYMPGLSGIQLQQQLVASDFDLPIVFITGEGDIPMTVQAIQAGAIDFLPKPVDDQKLIDTVQQAIDRNARERTELVQRREFRDRFGSLSKRENDVIMLVICGLLNKQIARRLGITENTVKVHRGRAMVKTEVDSVAELVRLCEHAGIAPAED
ncbi:response regulator transcription factor [Novipirellula caenicola]|uniref:Response regulator protein TodT n=1 Tax=Novipirellula caenicola TaxID=1536901 RepID=A0ABP9VL87_9BACT